MTKTPAEASALTSPIPPKSLRAFVLLASVASGCTAAFILWLAITAAAKPLWASAGFLVVILVAAGLGVIAGLGRFAVGYGIASVSIAGTIAGGSLFAWRDLASNLGRDPTFGPLLLPWLGFEATCGVVILVAGGLAVLARRPGSWKTLGRGFAYLVPALVLLGIGYFGWSKIPTTPSGRVIGFGALLLGGGIVGFLLSLGGHHLIRAFELTADEPTIHRT